MSKIFSIVRSKPVAFSEPSFFSEPVGFAKASGMTAGVAAIIQGHPDLGKWYPKSTQGTQSPPVTASVTQTTPSSATIVIKKKKATMPSGKPNCGTGHGGFRPGNICGKGKRKALAEQLKAARLKAHAGEISIKTLREHAKALKDHRRGKWGAIKNEHAKEIRDLIRHHGKGVIKEAKKNSAVHATRVAAAAAHIASVKAAHLAHVENKAKLTQEQQIAKDKATADKAMADAKAAAAKHAELVAEQAKKKAQSDKDREKLEKASADAQKAAANHAKLLAQHQEKLAQAAKDKARMDKAQADAEQAAKNHVAIVAVHQGQLKQAEEALKVVAQPPQSNGPPKTTTPPKTPKSTPGKVKMTMKPKVTAPPATPHPDELTFHKKLGGSTGAELHKSKNGDLFVVKKGANEGHLREEHAADKLYRAMGVLTPAAHLHETKNGPVKVSTFIEGQTLQQLRNSDPVAAKKAEAEIRHNFAADALLGNWDVVGTGADNILVTNIGNVHRIDNGGSLRYRAQGGIKAPHQWSEHVGELTSMRSHAINSSAAKVFSSLTDEDVVKQVEALAKKRAKILKAAPAELQDILGKRLDNMVSQAAAMKAKIKADKEDAKVKAKQNALQQKAADKAAKLASKIANKAAEKAAKAAAKAATKNADKTAKAAAKAAAIQAKKAAQKATVAHAASHASSHLGNTPGVIHTPAIGNWTPKPESDFRRIDFSEIPEWTKNHFESWGKNLTPKEGQVLKSYTGSSYVTYNKYLREGKRGTDSYMDSTIKTLEDALAKTSAPEDMLVYRGVNKDAFRNNGIDIADLKMGDKLEFKGFSSTTLNANSGWGYHKLIIRVPKGTPGAYVNANMNYSTHPHEKEFLLPESSSKYRVVKVEPGPPIYNSGPPKQILTLEVDLSGNA